MRFVLPIKITDYTMAAYSEAPNKCYALLLKMYMFEGNFTSFLDIEKCNNDGHNLTLS